MGGLLSENMSEGFARGLRGLVRARRERDANGWAKVCLSDGARMGARAKGCEGKGVGGEGVARVWWSWRELGQEGNGK